MSLKERLSEDMKDAMRARDSARLESIRMLRAAIQRREVDARLKLDDDGVLAVLQKQAKQHQDSIAQFEGGGREDLATKERGQLKVLQTYLPEQMDQAEVDQLINEAMQETSAASMKDMGRVMALIKPKLQGRADMGAVSSYIKARLQS